MVLITHWMFQAWVRYGHSCYRVTNREQTHEDAMMEYYCQGPLLTVENRCVYLEKTLFWLIHFDSLFLTRPSAPPGRFEQAFINSLLSESGANSSTHYWTGLMEAEDSKETLTFTNWNKHQPGSSVFPACWLLMSALQLPTFFFAVPFIKRFTFSHPFL